MVLMTFSIGALIFTFVMGMFFGFILISWATPVDLDQRLRDAIDREDYEEAAKIQEMIKRKKH